MIVSTLDVSYTLGHLRIRHAVDSFPRSETYLQFDPDEPIACVARGISFMEEREIPRDVASQAIKAAMETPGLTVTVGTGLPLSIAV